MVTRLSASDASFYQLENTATPMYVGLLLILRQPLFDGFQQCLVAQSGTRTAQSRK